MNIALWILAAVAAAAYAAAGASLILMPKEKYRTLGPSQQWVDDFEPGHVKVIGAVKLVGAVGLVAPAALGIAPVLVPLAACGLMLFMAGAVTTRLRRSEWTILPVDLLYLSAFAFLAWGRFDLQPF